MATAIFEDINNMSMNNVNNEKPSDLSFEESINVKTLYNFKSNTPNLPTVIEETETNCIIKEDEQFLMILNQARTQGILTIQLLDELLNTL
jgi:hypothetical protein